MPDFYTDTIDEFVQKAKELFMACPEEVREVLLSTYDMTSTNLADEVGAEIQTQRRYAAPANYERRCGEHIFLLLTSNPSDERYPVLADRHV